MIESNSQARASSPVKIDKKIQKEADKLAKKRLEELKRADRAAYERAAKRAKENHDSDILKYVGNASEPEAEDARNQHIVENTIQEPTIYRENPDDVKESQTLSEDIEKTEIKVNETADQKREEDSENNLNQPRSGVEKIDLSELLKAKEEIKAEGIELSETYALPKAPKAELEKAETDRLAEGEDNKTEKPDQESKDEPRPQPQNSLLENPQESLEAESFAGVEEKSLEVEDASKDIEEAIEPQKEVETTEASDNLSAETERNLPETKVEVEKPLQVQQMQEVKPIKSQPKTGAQKIDLDEINRAKREIMIERGEISASADEEVSFDPYGKPVTKKTTKKNEAKKMKDGFVAPEESVQDDITEEDILAQMKIDEELAAKNEEENYEGMTEEQIAEAKERKKVFESLKQKYSDKDIKKSTDIGEYKKTLDFSVNQDIKHFKVRPPKKPFIIAGIIFAILAVGISVMTYFLLNRPAAPVRLEGIRLSQSTTYQYVGDDLDLRGLYIDMLYSDKSIKRIELEKSHIIETSSNISNNKIVSYDSSTYIVVSVKGNRDKLSIVLSDPRTSAIASVQLAKTEFEKGAALGFDQILILANVINSINGELIGKTRLDASMAKFELSGAQLAKTETGIVMNGALGNNILKISFNTPYKILTYEIQITLI